MIVRPTCIGCGAQAPNTETNYTLISATFGWRLARTVLPDGSRAVEWRCPTCWSAHKNGTAPAAPARPKRFGAAANAAPAGAASGGARESEPPPAPGRGR